MTFFLHNKDVTRYAYVLAESDNLTIEEQKKLLIGFKLPIATLVESGGKSVHAAVKVDAKDAVEYRQRALFLFDWLAKHKFIVDENNKNEARLSRLPGAMRNGNLQRLIATNIGCSSWLEWKDYIEGVDDDLPQTVSLLDQLGDRLLLAYNALVQERVLLEELTHLTLSNLLKDSLWLVSVLRILLHLLKSDSLLLLNDLSWAVVNVD